MKNPKSLLSIVALLVMLTCNQVQATPETGIDYSQTTATVMINTISTAAPNVLRSKTIVCPENGFLVATANALFSFNVNNPTFPGTIAYSISRNSTAFDPDHQHNVFGNYVFDFHVPACSAWIRATPTNHSLTDFSPPEAPMFLMSLLGSRA